MNGTKNVFDENNNSKSATSYQVTHDPKDERSNLNDPCALARRKADDPIWMNTKLIDRESMALTESPYREECKIKTISL